MIELIKLISLGGLLLQLPLMGRQEFRFGMVCSDDGPIPGSDLVSELLLKGLYLQSVKKCLCAPPWRVFLDLGDRQMKHGTDGSFHPVGQHRPFGRRLCKLC